LLVNANSKLQAISGSSENSMLRYYVEINALRVTAIFHIPKAHQEARTIPPASQPIFLADTATPGPSAESGAGPSVGSTGAAGSLEGQHHIDLDNHDLSDSNVKFEDYDYGSEEDVEPDTINGLSFSEMDTVITASCKIIDGF
jgi:hypothetical protein